MPVRGRRWCAVLAATAVLAALPVPASAAVPTPFASIVPTPVTAEPAPGVTFELRPSARITSDVPGIGDYLAGILRRSTGYPLPVSRPAPGAAIALLLSGAPASVGEEGYRLDITRSGVTVRARKPAGLFAGVQTVLQLLPPAAQATSVGRGPWRLTGGRVVDWPRFAYRGAMLDVARHFFTVDQVKRYLDQLARYKLNTVHLHLTDDQGWRLMINGWERLATHGGSTAVAGDPGGYYTQAEYAEIVAYAQSRYLTVVPEIDMPGHTNAALASYAELNCDGKAPPLYTGVEVGFSSLCVDKPVTYEFVDAVIGQLAALTPGKYLHIGGDETMATKPADFRKFIKRVQGIVESHGKTMMGWHEITRTELSPASLAQFWFTTVKDPDVAAAVRKGTKVVLSPAPRTYLNMKYNKDTVLGQDWAGYIEARKSYDWDPGAYLEGVPEPAVLGVEAPLWTSTIRASADIEYMIFPRLVATAEIGWSPRASHNWDTFRVRLGAQGPLWTALGINHHRSPEVPWATGP
ncbi:hexosaminidase [Crossiella equi]|uniref:beta-N-acetylhexosaminidase n=1 Tax=Crossiella equi TaxID=130796 RepID=A0ABS5ARJ4_9PSEU|nr:beta-N-acetylhexosaminidase [Crossiella equi]MBP2479175.1 hexosaminidase [Crossiella equi]